MPTFRIGYLHRAPHRKLSPHVQAMYHFDKFSIRRRWREQKDLVGHLQPRRIMALQQDNTMLQRHKPPPIRTKHLLRLRAPSVQIRMERRIGTLQPRPAKMRMVVECLPEKIIHTRDHNLILHMHIWTQNFGR